MAEETAAYELNTGVAAPFRLEYIMTVRNKDTEYIVEVEDGSVKITRGIDSIPAKMSFKAINDAALDITEGITLRSPLTAQLSFPAIYFPRVETRKIRLPLPPMTSCDTLKIRTAMSITTRRRPRSLR